MLRTIMTKIAAPESTQHHAIRIEQVGGADLPLGRPARRAIGDDILCPPRSPDRHGDRADDRSETARGGDHRALEKDPRRVSVERKPPPEESRRWIEWRAKNNEPGSAELRLIAEPPGSPLRR